MRRVRFSDTDASVSEMCLGTMTFGDRVDEGEADRLLGYALDEGVDFLDTAAMYGDGSAESLLGKILRGRREKVFLATKVHTGLDQRSIEDSIRSSLGRLNTDHVDLYLIHWPQVGMAVESVMAGLDAVVRDGLARFVGVCNYPAWLVSYSNRIASETSGARLRCNQVAYNLLERGVEVEVLPQAATERVAVMAYRPLSMGVLTGKYVPGEPLPEKSRGLGDARVATWVSQFGDALDGFLRYCETEGMAPSAAALAWIRHSSAVTSPVVGVSSFEQLETAIQSFDSVLTDEQYRHLSTIFAATEVSEEGLQRFPGTKYNYPRLRRNIALAKPADS